MAKEPEPRPSITKVWAKNFRSIEYAELELDPLTVLVGPNASGKSNLLDVLRFVRDAVDGDLESAITERGGIDSVGRRSPRGRAHGPEIGLHFEDCAATIHYAFTIANKGDGDYEVTREYISWTVKSFGGNSMEIEIRNGHLTKPRIPQRKSLQNQEADYALKNALNRVSYSQSELHIPYEQAQGTITTANMLGHDQLPDSDSFGILSRLLDYLNDIHFYHIFPSSLRAIQKLGFSYHLIDDGQNLASVLRDMIQRESPFLPDLKQALAYVVPEISDVRVTQFGSHLMVELKHDSPGRSERNSWFDLSYESDGTLRLLGLLVALFQDPAPSLIGIEEPELTIHPGALAILSDTMEEAKLRTQVLVTTHSPDLIDRLPIESIRAVTAEGGSTKVGKVAEHQRRAVREGLFSSGELHRMEGLQIEEGGN